MDWQTKEYLDERLDSIEDTLALITEKLGISEDNETEESEDIIEEETENTNSNLEI